VASFKFKLYDPELRHIKVFSCMIKPLYFSVFKVWYLMIACTISLLAIAIPDVPSLAFLFLGN